MKAFQHSYLLLLLLLLVGCKKEVLPGESGAFMRLYGSNGADFGTSVFELPDGGFVISGSQTVEGQGEDMLLLRTDADGNLLWRKTFGGQGDDKAEQVVPLADGSFVLLGFKSNGSNGGQDAYMVKTDAAGTLIWEKEFGGSSNDFGFALVALADGGFAIGGYTSSFGHGATDSKPNFMLIRTDANGNQIWLKAYGGTGDDKAFSLIQASDGGFLLCGHSSSYASVDYEAQVLRTTANGDSLWTYHGISNYNDQGRGIVKIDDSTYAWVGFSFQNNTDYDVILEWINDRGEAIPNKRWKFGGADNDRIVGSQFLIDSDGSPILAAYSQSYGHGANDIYLLKGAEPLAQPQWQHFYGGSNEDVPSGLIRTRDGGLALVGYSKSFDASDAPDIFFLKTNSEGVLLPLGE